MDFLAKNINKLIILIYFLALLFLCGVVCPNVSKSLSLIQLLDVYKHFHHLSYTPPFPALIFEVGVWKNDTLAVHSHCPGPSTKKDPLILVQ